MSHNCSYSETGELSSHGLTCCTDGGSITGPGVSIDLGDVDGDANLISVYGWDHFAPARHFMLQASAVFQTMRLSVVATNHIQ